MLIETKNSYCVYHQFPIFVSKRHKLQKYLENNDIETSNHYGTSVHKTQPFFEDILLPNTNKWSNEEISLPIYPFMDLNDIDYVSEKIINFYLRKDI